jgi:hypothetical protein
VVEWQENYPKDHFLFMPASESTPSDDTEILRGVGNLEQDDEDEVFPQIQKMQRTEFFFCHQTEFQRHLLYRLMNLPFQ